MSFDGDTHDCQQKVLAMRMVADLKPHQLDKLRVAARRYRLRPNDQMEQAWLLNVIDLLHLDPEDALDFALDLREPQTVQS